MRKNDSYISKMYVKHYDHLVNYIAGIVNKREDAENIAQDVWIRVLTSDKEMQEDTGASYLFTIAGNLCRDYLRRAYRKRGYLEESILFGDDVAATTPETELIASELGKMESLRVSCLPSQRKLVYIKSRFEEKQLDEIAEEMQLSKRTVENHLRMSRREVRDFISAIA